MKLGQFQNYLKKTGTDLAILIYPDPSITYFSQIKPSQAILLIKPKKAELFLTRLDKKPKLSGVTVREFTSRWVEVLKDRTIAKVGVNESSLTLAYLNKLKTIYPNAKFIDISHSLIELRSCKTSEEISLIDKACQITVSAFDLVVGELRRGTLRTEQDVSDFLEKSIRSMGGDLAFPTIVAMGKNAATPHHKTSQNELKRGFLLMDFGASYNNYCSDMTRVVFLGKPNQVEIADYNLLLNTQEDIIHSITKGSRFKQLDKQARKSLGKYSSSFIHSLGHGIGIEVHESPIFSNNKHQVSDNQVFTIEPGIYFPGRFGLRIEDTLVFNGDTKILTTATKNLIKIQIKP